MIIMPSNKHVLVNQKDSIGGEEHGRKFGNTTEHGIWIV